MAFYTREPRSEPKPVAQVAPAPENTVQIDGTRGDWRICGMANCRAVLPLPEPETCPVCGLSVRPQA